MEGEKPQSAAPSVTPDLVRPEQPSQEEHRILVVEDDRDVADTICEMLQMHGYTVVTVASGADALNALDQSGKFSLVLTDVVMPHMGGFELARRIQERADAPVVALVSGYAPTTESIRRNASLPMIGKPFTLQQLLCFVRDLVA